MPVLRIIVLLAGVVSALLFPIFVGHSFSSHETGPVVFGTIGLVVGAVLIFISTKIPDPTGHHGH